VIIVQCPSCGKESQFADYLKGLTIICKNCSKPLPVLPPSQDAPASEVTAGGMPSPPPAKTEPPQPVQLLPQTPPSVPERSQPGVSVRGTSESSLSADWANEYVATSLKMGIAVPEIEQRLIARGLSPEAASAAVTKCLSATIRDQSRLAGLDEDHAEKLHRIASAVVACLGLVLAYFYNSGRSVAITLSWLALPMACIWNAEAMVRSYDQTSPLKFVRWGAWTAVIAILGYRIVLLALKYQLI
jgi:hypothetical protein